MRAALLEDGRRLLEGLLAQVPAPAAPPQPGQRVYPDRPGEVVSLFGPLTLRRDYHHPPGPAGGFPWDQALGLIGGFTPGAARLLARTAAQLPYLESSAQVRELAGLSVDPSQIQRLVQLLGPGAQARLPQLPGPLAAAVPQFYVSVDGTGVPMVRSELAGRKGRGPDSTTYVGSFAAAEDFGLAVRAAALRRGVAQADTVIYLGDGAAWVWEVARTCFAQAVQILDYDHASEHVGALAQAVYADADCAQNWAVRWRALLYDSELEVLLAEARAVAGETPSAEAQRELAYLERNRERMDYRRYRQAGWFIGSGVVEAGCKRVIGQRLKQSGMFWTEAGATAVLSLRCALLSAGGWEQLWSQPLLQAA